MPKSPVKKPDSKSAASQNSKTRALEAFKPDVGEGYITTNQGLRISDNQNSLKAGARGPTLLEDFILREKITHFDHERIPERIVHARGNAAHGFFQVYKPLANLSKAHFLQDPGVKTPVFVRFSTVAGSRGSADTPRDVRGFAVKFYTEEGNFDLVGNNMPVFFIQDSIKFPDLIHAVKPEPHNEIPQAASAHDTFYDFITQTPESIHMMLWVMSDRALPRSQRMMEGFGVHTFRLINAKGVARFVKFHWKPLLGVHSLAWDESQKISGKDPDFLRRDLWEAIDQGKPAEWELGVQVVEEADEHKFDFDLLDPTKLIPEELVPVQRIGKMTLNKNPDNYFAETEQVAFHVAHIVPGIDFSNDPLMQGRLFSYLDTQISRLGGANFHEIPINRPVCPFHNNQRDGIHRMTIAEGGIAYDRNTLGRGLPKEATVKEGGFASYAEHIDAEKIRARSASFGDYFSQARLFWNSQSEAEKQHIVEAFQFELAKVATPILRERMVGLLAHVDDGLASRVASVLEVNVASAKREASKQLEQAKAAVKEAAAKTQTAKTRKSPERSMALSTENQPKASIATRKIAFLVAEGADAQGLHALKAALMNEGATVKIIAPKLGALKLSGGKTIAVDQTLATSPSVVFDAVYIAGGKQSVEALLLHDAAKEFVLDAYRHCKSIAAEGEALELLKVAGVEFNKGDTGLIISQKDRLSKQQVGSFIEAIAAHRFWQRGAQDRKIAA